MADKLERRRLAFWRNTEYTLDRLLEELEARISDKWVDTEDGCAISHLICKINSALCEVRGQYGQILQSYAIPLYDEDEIKEKK